MIQQLLAKDKDESKGSKKDEAETKKIIEQLIAKDKNDLQSRKEEEEKETLNNNDGRAFKLIERVLELEKKDPTNQIEAISRDDLFFFAEKFMITRTNFLSINHPANATVAYHYTAAASIPTIKTVGLLTKADMDANQGAVKGAGFHGAAYGDGVYVSVYWC